ncbi:polysaccharide biosynthesis protein [Nocardia asteroides]|uniref:polysaccharide biosynthesis protein n=1 Tax=Nocardia asteroides TaxID=1824 RepID=UPI001E62632C|nr:polysaccharide biosynthesis protein [Nocardia asteroides]UGT52413.1 polysaccharide biosynthesis protein [Nocardia asteroides]
MTANVAGYLLQLLASRWLGVAGFSEFASLLAVQLLCAVPALAMQNVVAREVVHGAELRAVRAMQWRCAALVAAVAVVLVPVVAGVLHVGVWAAAAALGAAPALVVLSGEQGILQGSNRFRALAAVLALAGTARVAPALIALVLGGGAAGALWAAAAGIVCAAFVAGRIARTTRAGGGDPAANSAGESKYRIGVLPVLRAVQVQAALMALSSADLIVVRIVLDDTEASQYSLGTVATKIAFWLPQAVGVVLYPRMAQAAHSGRAIRDALSVLSLIGLVAVLGAAVAAPLAPLFAGRDYAPIQDMLWVFALHGAILAVLQGALLSAIAVERTALAALTWLGLAVEVVLMLTLADSIGTLITTAVSVAAVTTVLVALVVLRTAGRATPAADPAISDRSFS